MLRVRSQLASNNVLAHVSILFSAELLRTKFQLLNFLFSSLLHGRGKENVPTATKIWREKVCRINVFRAKHPLHPQKIACSYTYVKR